MNQNDIIRIDHKKEDINLSVIKLYDEKNQLINKSNDVCYIKIKEKCSIGDKVYKTKDIQYYNSLKEIKEFKRFNLDIKVYAYPQSNLIIEANGLNVQYIYQSEEILESAQNNPTGQEQIVKQFSKLKETVFQLGHVEFEGYNVFIPVKLLNQARREIVNGLYELKLKSKDRRVKEKIKKEKISFPEKKPYLTASVMNLDQYEACKEAGIETIYYQNVIRRNQNEYKEKEGELLIGGYGGIYKYKDTNPFVSDYSLNVVNSASIYQLHALNAKRVTLSYEMNEKQIKDCIQAYYKENDGYPSLEMIVYGRAPLMFTNYCPLKKLNQCGNCKKKQYELKDEYGSFPIVSHEDCTTTLLNGKILNLLDEMNHIEHVEAFRLNFTIESKEETIKILQIAKEKLAGSNRSVFNQNTDTRGHFNKEIA